MVNAERSAGKFIIKNTSEFNYIELFCRYTIGQKLSVC